MTTCPNCGGLISRLTSRERILLVICILALALCIRAGFENVAVARMCRDESFRYPVRRGCVQLEFSPDLHKWGTEDNPDSPYPYMRLRNTCSGLTVRVDVSQAGASQ